MTQGIENKVVVTTGVRTVDRGTRLIFRQPEIAELVPVVAHTQLHHP